MLCPKALGATGFTDLEIINGDTEVINTQAGASKHTDMAEVNRVTVHTKWDT